MPERFFDTSRESLRGVQEWQRDPSNVETYPGSPESFYAGDKDKQKIYLELLARLMQSPEQYQRVVGSWHEGSPDAYMDPTYQAAWAVRESPSYLNK